MNLVLLYEGVSAFEAAGALAALHAAGLPAEWAAGNALVPTREGARLVPARLGFDAVEGAPSVTVPGGDLSGAMRDATLVRALRARRGKWALFSGSATRIAAAAGLANGRRIATLPGEAAPEGAVASHARLVADGRLLTCVGGDSIVDLALHYASREQGDEAARKAALALAREYVAYVLGAREDEERPGAAEG